MSGTNTTTPINLNPNLACLVQNFLHFVKFQENVASQMQIEKKSVSNLSKYSSSMHSYLTYRKNIHNRLSQINKNISNTIIEGCRGIDTICYRVRQCLEESQNIERCRSTYSDVSWSVEESKDIKRNNRDSTEISVIESMQDTLTEKNESSHIKEEIVSAITLKTSEEPTNIQYNQEQKITEKLSSAKMKRQIQKRNLILEEFRESVMDQIELNDFEAMEKIVENLNEDIENFDKKVAESEETSTGDKTKLQKEIEVITNQTVDAQESMQILKLKDYKFEHFEPANPETQFLIPEVYPKPSITDLHKKLIAQLEANDSYLCFQRLMDSHAKLNESRIRKINSEMPAVSRTTSNRTVVGCSSTALKLRKTRKKKKSHHEITSKKNITESSLKLANVRLDLYAKYSDSLWFSERYLGKPKSSRSSVKSKRNNKKQYKDKPEQAVIQKDKLREIKKTLRSTSKSTSICGGFRSDATIALTKCTASSYSCNLKINNDAPIAPSTKCHLRWIRMRNEQAPSRKIEYLDILDDLTSKDLLPLQSEYPRRDRQGSVKYFSESQTKQLTSSDDSKSIKETYLYRLLHQKNVTHTTWDHLLKPSIECCNVDCSCQRHGALKCDEKKQNNTPLPNKDSTVQKLLPFMQDPTNIHFQSVIVMPVRVFYDYNNFRPTVRSPSNPHDQKQYPVAMKEAKGDSRAKWVPPNQGSSKSLRVVRSVKQQQQNKISEHSVQQESKISVKRNSKVYLPKDRDQLEKHVKVHSDIEKKSMEIEEKTPRGFGRKLWANKYGKSVGHQLISYVNKQPQQSKPVLPKHALPNGPRGNKIPCIKNTVRHKQMLAHLRGLKEKNDEIQCNIQKAINVIETKMIDILSAPGQSSSVEAFDLMEKEITNVLSLMKFSSKGNSKNSTPKTAERKGTASKKIDNLEEDFNSISNQLFKKLEKILDSDQSRATSASDPDNKQEEANKTKPSTPKKDPVDDRYQSSSFTSTSLEDINHKKYENNNLSKKSRTGRCLNSRRLQKEEDKLNKNATLKEIEREYARGENYDKPRTKFKTIAKQEHDETDKSQGDCIKQSSENVLSATSLNDVMADRLPYTELPENDKIVKENEGDADKENQENMIVGKAELQQPVKEEEESGLPLKSGSEESDTGLSNQVNKIIKRVEDIYNHLDDIHISNDDQIPVFSEPPDVSEVASQQFLTPFMQAVIEKRSRPVTPNTKVLERSPSYYNVLTFLDTLSAIQKETPTEVHIARLCYYSQISFIPAVSHQAHIEHLMKMEKPGCLRKHSEEGKSKHKKVSFLVLKENKSSQASICPYHKFKVMKVSSQQFPPTDDSDSPKETCSIGSEIQYQTQENSISVLYNKKDTYRHDSDYNNNQSTQVYCQTRTENSDSDSNSEQDNTQQITDTSEYSAPGEPPQINVYYDKSDEDIPKVVFNDKSLNGSYSHQTILEVKNSTLPKFRARPRIVVFREVSEVSGLLQPLKDMDKFSKDTLIEENGHITTGQLTKINSDIEHENVALLKSFYAFVYIIMFTALNLDYRCA